MEPTSNNLSEEVQEAPPPSDRNRPVKPARELKVEDALLYLDQVKMEFSDKPQIYNEFLDIMKNFKSQSINTPGVIERVKNLFKGYNKLILGFNTFLPEGEGYKIELTPEEQAFNHPGHEASSASLSTPARLPGQFLGRIGDGSVIPGAEWHPNMGVGNYPPAQPAVPPQPHPANPAGSLAPQQMQQAHAIHYVTKIRNRFSTEPDTYRQFLKILHTYQKEQKGIKEVLEQVSQLFSEHPDLLMEFTYFLPDAVQDQAKERLHRAARESEARKHARAIALKQKNKLNTMQATMNASVGMLNAANAANRALNRAGGSSNDLLMAPVGLGGQRGGGKRMMMDMMTGGLGAESLSQMSDKDQLMAQREKMLASLPAKKKAKMEAPGGVLYNLNRAGGDDDGLEANESSKKPRRNMKGGPQHDMNSTDLRVNGGKLSANALLASNLNFRSNKESHISMSAERKFFDTVKEVLISNNRENWTEFVKCLELFANDSIGRNELFELVSDLLTANAGQGTGSTGNELMLEFKRLMSNRTDYVANKEDVWFAVPLSEVDFSQCRKCTPSYRALPRDYPKPKCTERSEEECTVLNDQWVSIPIGSEESYAFKHMRKNQYEEQLFKIEDDRFEIDMIIDSNMNTIRVLEPLAEELSHFKSVDPAHADGNPVSGLTPRFTFQLEPRHLSTINLNAISRIYGETHGEEILELLRKNPAAAIPVILKRLRQKDVEWRAARVELNNTWKEIVSNNHFKSFDHRSFYFRQSDKKYLSTRQMVNEIVGVPPVGSGISSTASVVSANTTITNAQNAELVKSQEETAIAGIASSIDEANVPTLKGIKPQLVLNYANCDHQVHRDIYKIMCHAAETHLSNSQDKEKLAALWRDLLRVFFNIPPHYLYSQNPNDNAQNSVPAPIFLHPSEAWLPNTRIITLYGSGVVKSFRAKDSMYEVQLPFGTAFLNPNVIYGAEELSKQALNAIGVTTDPETGVDKIYNGLVTSNLENPSETVKDPSKLFYGTQMCYIFLRLHHTLYIRLSMAHKLALEAAQHQAYLEESAAGSNNRQFTSNYNNSTLLQHMDAPDTEAHMLNGEAAPTAKSRPIYNQFFGYLLSLVEGNIDNAKFEDITRSLLGNKSYMLYTLDKIIHQGIKHLQAMANDENVNKLVGLFVYHHYKATTGTKAGIDPTLYQNHVSHILSHTMEDVYRIQLLTRSAGVSQGMSQVGIQHLGILNPNDISSLANNSNANSTSNLSQLDVSTGGAADHHAGNMMSPHNLKSASRDSTLSPRVGDESRAPKAVVSDGEDDDQDEDDEGTANNDNEDAPPSPPKSSMYSPRTRQFMS